MKSLSCDGQITFDFTKYKNQQIEIVKCSENPKVYTLFDEDDSELVEIFKKNFIRIEYEKVYSSNIDYILVFLSENSLKNEEFLRVFLDIKDGIDSRKMIGLIVDDDLRSKDKRFELYEHYSYEVKRIWDLKKRIGTNADIRSCGNIYERCNEEIGQFLEKVLIDEANKKICAEDKFESCLMRDGKKELRVKWSKENAKKEAEEGKCAVTNYEYNNCNIVMANNNDRTSINQKQGLEKKELELLCETIKKEVRDLDDERKSEYLKILEEIREEYNNSEIKKSNKLKRCLELIVPLLTIVNGTPTLLQNLLKLQSFFIERVN